MNNELDAELAKVRDWWNPLPDYPRRANADKANALLDVIDLLRRQRDAVHGLSMPHDCWHFESEDVAITKILRGKE